MASDTPARPASKLPLLLIFVTVFIDLLGFGIVLPLLPRYARYYQADGQTLGILMASFSAMQFLFAPIWGRLSDRVGRRPVLMLGLLGSLVFYSLFGYVSHLGSGGSFLGLGPLTWLLLCRIGAGIAGATIPTAQAYIADVTTPENRGKGMAMIGAAFGIGFTFGPLLGAMFVSGDLSDVRTLSRPESAQRLNLTAAQSQKIQTVLTGYESQLQSRRQELKRGERDELRRNRERDVLQELDAQQQAQWRELSAPSPWPGYVAGLLSGGALLFSIFMLPESLRPGASQAPGRHWLDLRVLSTAIAQPSIALLLFTMFLTTFAFAQFESTLSLLTAFLGLNDRYNYFIFAYIGFVLTISQGFLVRRLIPRVGEFRMSVAGTVLMTVGLALIGIAGEWDSVAMLCAVVPICVVGFSALTPSLSSLLSRQTADSDQGGVLGLGQSMSALARILGPLVGLRLNDVNVVWPYWVAAAVMAFSVLLTLLLKRMIRPDSLSTSQSAPAMH